MYLRLINVKAIERQRDSYILVINNRYEKMGESLYRINKDALEIIRNLNGTKTFDDLVDMMISCHLEKKTLIPDMEKGFYIKLKTEIATQRIVEHLHRILQ